jgi:hypothetical protein
MLSNGMNDALQRLLPKDKLDVGAAERLSAAGYPAIAPLLPALLEWMQDLNWPVAQAVRPILAEIGAPLASGIRSVLQTDDDIWKYWTVICLVAESKSLTLALLPELERLASSPTEGEREERVDVVARNILRRLETGTNESVLPEEYAIHNRQILGDA